MRLRACIWAVLAVLPLGAQTTGALSVRNLSVEGDKQQVSFDVVNNSSKAVRNWTMTIHMKKQGIEGGVSRVYDSNMLTTGCSGSGATPLAPGASYHCNGSLYSGEAATVLSADVVVTSVLFDDGSAEGDVSLPDGVARQRLSTMRTLEYWIGQLSPALSAGTPREQLEAMRQALSAPDSTVPENLRYDLTAIQQRQRLLSQVGRALQTLDTPPVQHPEAQAAGTVALLRQQLEQMRSEPDRFPPSRGAALGLAAGDPLQGWKAVDQTGALQLVAVRTSDDPMKTMTLVLQNQASKGISAFSVSFGASTNGDRASQTEECFGSATPVCASPGSAVSLYASAPDSRVLNVDAVVFSDGSGAGTQSEIDAIQYSRLGLMFETERIWGILEASNADFATIRSALGGLPQSLDETFASLAGVKLPGITLDRVRQAGSRTLSSFFSGVRNGREFAARRLPEYERRAGSPAGALAEMRREFHDLSTQYRAYCQKLYEAGR